ncbi:MAG: SIR2 family protein [Carboxylicivirga sp.]|jgi:NAD-dependent SIR2 family protein deacetylase|nr:SIR2 family protein [Carboxylicivirga sp.]
MNNEIEKHRLRIKKYLGLENVSVLTGAGTSFHLGAPVIRTIPEELKQQCEEEIKKYFGEGADPSYEDLFNCLQADRYMLEKRGNCVNSLNESIAKMQKWLFENCDTQKTKIHEKYENNEQLKKNRYHYHEALVKKLLQRPNNLKRANLFTTNYDMAFDYALDNLGVHYINGFMGVHNRCFRPEVYDYDLYYPGQSVTGKVHRAEKVIKYYKIHGSLSWLSTQPSVNNTYGIKEIPLNDEFKPDGSNEIMIYPCVSKKSFTLDLPYSELFRQFAQSINQPQSVLFCIGYSFYDEHINDLIRQALSIPSFTLIIANFSPTIDKNSPIEELRALKDKRIIILEQNNPEISTFTGFVENVMPDLYEEEEMESVIETLQKLYPDSTQEINNKEVLTPRVEELSDEPK